MLYSTEDFLEKLNQFKLKADNKLVSFDVQSLFTNVLLDQWFSTFYDLWPPSRDSHTCSCLLCNKILCLYFILVITGMRFCKNNFPEEKRLILKRKNKQTKVKEMSKN